MNARTTVHITHPPHLPCTHPQTLVPVYLLKTANLWHGLIANTDKPCYIITATSNGTAIRAVARTTVRPADMSRPKSGSTLALSAVMAELLVDGFNVLVKPPVAVVDPVVVPVEVVVGLLDIGAMLVVPLLVVLPVLGEMVDPVEPEDEPPVLVVGVVVDGDPDDPGVALGVGAGLLGADGVLPGKAAPVSVDAGEPSAEGLVELPVAGT